MKHIGIITHNYPETSKDRQNAGIFVSDLAQELSKKNKISVYSPGESTRISDQGKVKTQTFKTNKSKKLGDLKIWNLLDILRFIDFFIGGFSNLSKFILENKVEVNIVMWAFPSGVFAYIAKKIYHTPYVTWCLGSDIYIYGNIPILKTIIKHILKNSDYVFADGIDLSEKTRNLSGRECIFIPSASKADFKINKNKTKSNKINLTFIGRMETVKGPDIFLKALLIIKNHIHKFRINFIGDGTLLDSLKQKAKENKIDKQLHFYGNVSDFQTISNVISRSDWLVIPSRSDSIPLVFSEAMKVGTPIITSDLPDLKYLVNKYKVGVIFEKENFRQLANLIVQLPSQEAERVKFSKNTKTAARDFSIEESALKLMKHIEKYE